MKRSDYAPEWHDVIRPLILKRDNYTCRHCGVKHRARVYKQTSGKYYTCDEFIEAWAISEGKKVFTLYLQVAHLDQDKLNNEPDNLLSLCPSCHSSYDAEFKKLKRISYRKKIENSNTSIKGQPSEKNKIDYFEIKKMIIEFTGVGLKLNDVKILTNKILSYGTSKDQN